MEFTGKGGLIHYAFQLSRALATAGAEVTLVTARHYELDALVHPFRLEKLLELWDPKPPGAPQRASVLQRWVRRAGRALLHYRAWYRLVLYLRRERPDIVQFGDIRFPTDLPFLVVLRRAGLRLADVCHNLVPFASGRGLPRASPLMRSLFTRIYRQFDVVFTHFEANRRGFQEAYGLDPQRVVAIPHGNELLFAELADPRLDPDSLRRRIGLAPGDRVVLFFGTLSRYKGVDLLLQAFARVRRRLAAARLVVAGFPAPDFDPDAHVSLARSLGIEADVRFHPGYVESGAVASWLGLAAVVALPYRAVFQSGALHVAQAFGVPVVATRVGAMAEAIVEGESGLVVPPDDPGAFAEALLRVLDDPALGARLGRRAHEQARDRFAWERVAAILLDRYRLLLATDRGTEAAG